MTHPLIILWAPPRSLSTAFLRIIAARGDFSVMNEPLCDLAAGVAHHANDLDNTRLHDFTAFLRHVDALRARGPVFVKDTCEFDYRSLIAGSW